MGYTDLQEPIHAAQIAEYRNKIEQDSQKRGEKFGEIKAEVISVDGVPALQVEHDVFSQIDNSRSRMIRVAAPAPGRCFEIAFNFSSEQEEQAEAALSIVLKSFKIEDRSALNAESRSQWLRIFYYTAGGFAAGILLSLLLKILSGAGKCG